ncbi:hypothetical protein [Flavisolibacter nicotianae]|uniref:hypothetical protein n=1 Tax=Flavisolibacter nicotianae TaxID=2364882 RepID=UPI0013C438A4|nr:hypothetical protein [Flavisolibacter nicotianae]
MIKPNKQLWIGLSLINLFLVAFFGFILRSKILFPLPFVDYRNMLSAHSHFAFGGWVGLIMLVLLIYNLLPPTHSGKRFYQWMLAGIEISSLGMAVFFPFQGYSNVAIVFSSLYIVVTYVFAPVFLTDVIKTVKEKTIRLLAIAAVIALLVSAIGPLGLVSILLFKATGSTLYRDSIYTFLHFQYNGFFTLAVFALFFRFLNGKGITLNKQAQRFARFYCASLLPALFLSLLWHGRVIDYSLAAAGALLILFATFYFASFFRRLKKDSLFTYPLAGTLWYFSALSFLLKMLLNVGTLIPSLGHAVYGDRPVIIGFLHLVFLGFVTFFILSHLLEEGYFVNGQKSRRFPFLLFSFGIIATETLLMLQGLGILFKTNSGIYNWLLWLASICLFTGAGAIAWTYWAHKKAVSQQWQPLKN